MPACAKPSTDRYATVKCAALKADGTPCRANAPRGVPICHLHNAEQTERAAHRVQSVAGGLAKAAAKLVATDPLTHDPAVAALDLGTIAGLRDLQAANLRALARSAHDVKTANSITNAIQAQRSVIEASTLLARIEALEEALEGDASGE